MEYMRTCELGKKARYHALVKARKMCRVCSDLTNPSVYEGGAFDCEAIGAWSQWQGKRAIYCRPGGPPYTTPLDPSFERSYHARASHP